ncbi:MAG: hypothetical protein AB7P61_05245 [Gemmatimonadales bacterium]
MVSGMLALLIATMGPGHGPEKAVERYKVDLTMQQDVDLSAMGQGVMSNKVTATMFLNVTMSDTTGGRLAHVVVDSIMLNAEGQMAMMFPPAMADSARGEFIHAYIVDGKMEGTPTLSAEGNSVLGLVTQGLNGMFPGVGPKAAGKAGWADTVTTNTVNENANLNSSQIVTWTRTGMDGDVLMLSGRGEGSVTGEQQGNQISGTVTNTVKAETVIGGPARSAEVTSNQEMTVLSAQLPEPIPVKVTNTLVLMRLP